MPNLDLPKEFAIVECPVCGCATLIRTSRIVAKL